MTEVLLLQLRENIEHPGKEGIAVSFASQGTAQASFCRPPTFDLLPYTFSHLNVILRYPVILYAWALPVKPQASAKLVQGIG